MNQPDGEPKQKKTYQKPLLTKVELIAEEAVLSACKQGGMGGSCGALYTCSSSPGS